MGTLKCGCEKGKGPFLQTLPGSFPRCGGGGEDRLVEVVVIEKTAINLEIGIGQGPSRSAGQSQLGSWL